MIPVFKLSFVCFIIAIGLFDFHAFPFEYLSKYLKLQDFIDNFNCVIDNPKLHHANKETEETDEAEVEADNYVDMIVVRRRNPGEPLEQARVKRRALDNEGKPIGKAHETGNPLFDSRQ